MNRQIISIAWRTGLCVAVAMALTSCANFHARPDGPGDCVGPPGFCVPYFGANATMPDAKPALAYAGLPIRPAQAAAVGANWS
jgi:hypothetical protein